ncbi:MAG: LamG-like jellyroll fold domain-containing protein [Cyanobacteria bacterium J06560_5]
MNTASMNMMKSGNTHDMNGGHSAKDGMMSHGALEALIGKTKPTHVAVRSGKWSEASTWKNGRIPGNNANVLIEKGLTVTYDQVSDARLKTIANRGTLNFPPNQDTKLIVETILNAPEGKFNVGSAGRAVAADKTTEIIFTSDRGIDRQLDPTQLGKGLVSHGEVNIYGADKLDKVALVGDATAGNNVLKFNQAPTGWRVGDQVVLGGTEYGWNGNDKDNSRLQDEVLTITEINGREVKFTNNDIKNGADDVLRFDHKRSSLAATNNLNLYAANLTRNVSFSTENGKAVPIGHRAHVMLMHNPKVKVLNAGFYDLGRSDKSKVVDDIGTNMDGSKGRGTNIRGRYALHLHQTGVDNPNSQASILRGNAISGSPGWGIVQHESKAGLEDNVVFDVVGSGIVAESGNELGWWTDNLVIKTTGIDWKKAQQQRDNRKSKFDLGFDGDGYWIQGAGLIKNKDNKAISSNRAGMVLFGSTLDQKKARPIKTIPVKSLPKELQRLFAEGQTDVDIRDIPFSTVKGFESYNGTTGFRVWAHGTNFDGEGDFSSLPVGYRTEEQQPETAHSGKSSVENFKTWGNRYSGTEVFYSSNIELKNGLVLGRDGERVSNGRGIFSNHASFNSTFDNVTVAGYRQGAEVEVPNSDKEFNATTIKNSKFLKNTYNLGAYGDEAPVVDANRTRPDDGASYLKLQNNTFEDITANNRAPVAGFKTKAVGGLSVNFNANSSYDSDPLLPADGKPRRLDNRGIAAYGWDFNGDGKIDRFGRELNHTFDKAGRKNISLTVVDTQGQSTTTKQSVRVQPTAYSNAFPEGNFNPSTRIQDSWKAYSQWSDDGWFFSDRAKLDQGAARLSAAGDWGEFVGRVITDEKVRKGKQTFSFKLKNVEGAPEKNTWEKNEVAIKLWGINGPFYNSPYQQTGPEKIGTLPMQSTELLVKDFGGPDGPEGDFFNWKNFSFDLDLGKGYDHLLFQVNTSRTSNPADYVAIDNVSLTGAANSISGGGGSPVVANPNPVVAGDDKPPAPTNNPPVVPPKPTPGPGNASAPVAKLSFEEAIVRIAKDTSTDGLNNYGRFVGDPTETKGRVGQAVAFDGVKDMVAVRNSSNINRGIHDERTVSLWFQVDDTASKKKQVIYEEGGAGRGLNIYVEEDLLYVGGWNRGQSKWAGDWVESKKVTSDQWHHVALVLDGEETVTNGALTAYLDGQNVGEVKGSQLWDHADGIGLGNVNGKTRFKSGVSTGTDNGLAGAVDEFQVFNSALNSAQIKQLATSFI